MADSFDNKAFVWNTFISLLAFGGGYLFRMVESTEVV